MKRHESLIPLTHDHHHALAQARQLKLAANADGAERLERSEEFLRFYDTDTLTHFHQEEETVFPLAIDDAEAMPLLERAMMEHLRIHAAVSLLRHETEGAGSAAGTMMKLAELLEDHIRFEEKELFPLLERCVPRQLVGLSLS
jgi:iron-sulfur cluster repair protein YtfE (RIC family)